MEREEEVGCCRCTFNSNNLTDENKNVVLTDTVKFLYGPLV
jgi:hypothetical protein